jgi:hypothetical protein
MDEMNPNAKQRRVTASGTVLWVWPSPDMPGEYRVTISDGIDFIHQDCSTQEMGIFWAEQLACTRFFGGWEEGCDWEVYPND